MEGGCSIGKQTVTLAGILSRNVTKQAVWKRINDSTALFFLGVLQSLLGTMITANAAETVKNLISFFPRILLQDSTTVALHKTLFEHFPGSSNQNGATSSLKIQAVYDILGRTFAYFDMTSFRTNDQAFSIELDFLRPGDLLIRDLGYFSLKAFSKIAEMKAFFLSRLKYGVHVLDVETGEKINLLKLLRGKENLDMEISLGADSKLRARLVGEKLPKKLADKRRREYKQNRDQKLNPSKEHLRLLGWNLFITNIPRETWNVKTLALAYSLRWRIEIIFKSWKSCLSFNLVHKCSHCQIKVLAYSRLIVATLLSSHYYPRFEELVAEKSDKQLSLLKFVDACVSNADIMLDLLQSGNPRKRKLLLEILIGNATYEKRRRLNHCQKLMDLLAA